MKKFTLLIVSIIFGLSIQAQDYKITFTASGITNTLDSVHVKNLTQQTELTLNGTDVLHLYNNTGIIEEYKEKNEISFYPNPLKNGEGKLRFYQNKSGDTKVEVYDIEGKLLLSKQGNLQRGHNEFMFTGMPTGFFMVHVKSASFSRSLKIISIDGKQGTPKMKFVQNVQKSSTHAAASSIKLVKSIIGMQYNTGDRLKLMGYANNDTCIYFYIPDKSQMIDFVFGSYYPSGTVHCGVDGPTAVVDVTNPITVETWMDRNLGASQQATSSTDSQAYGDLYQWGRFSDGHQCRNSGTTTTQSSSDTPGHSDFIKGSSDWRSPQNNNLWQGVNGTNNPCPSGYRLPTINELNSERQSWSSDNAAGAYGSPLKWPAADGRRGNSGSLSYLGGYYWSFTVDGSEAYHLYFRSGNASMSIYERSDGYSVRCLKDASTQPPSIYTHPSDQTINDGGNASFGVIATGGSLTYQWQESTDGGTTWNNLSNGGVYSNVTTNTMDITSATLSMDSTQYRCVLSASGLPVDTSNAATLTVIYISTGSYPHGTVHCISGGAAVVDVTNSATGEIWMDRNLGAFQRATSSTDSLAYGDLYQWGRFSDGHQCRSSNTTNIKATTAMPNNGNPWDGKFITGKSSYDWLSSQNNNLWQGVNGTNNPCPSGYRLPTKNELNSERQSWSSSNAAGAYGSPLKLPVAGGRYYKNGSLLDVGSDGLYESSTVSGPGSDTYNLYFSSNDAGMDKGIRAGGASIRCLKDGSVQPPSIKTHPSGQTINDGGNASFSVSATGSSLSYQWQESTDGGTTWNALSNGAVYSNVTTDTMNITSATLSIDSTQYRCVLNASGLPVDTSNAATLTVITTSSSYPSATVHCISGGAAIVDVTNPTTGDTWMDRNLGASRQATYSTDSQAYGDLYQWGRFSDGHQCRSSNTTNTNASTATPNNGNSWDGKFITHGSSPYDWLSSQNNNLWQGLNGTNNPCPSGYRLPTENELNSERQSWSSDNAAGAYGSPLKWPAADGRRGNSGSLSNVGSDGYYRSSTVDGYLAYSLYFFSNNAFMNSNSRACEGSV
ncbi:MAG: FISUMP domain-containing protein, partial [Bacteroidales bacterium]